MSPNGTRYPFRTRCNSHSRSISGWRCRNPGSVGNKSSRTIAEETSFLGLRLTVRDTEIAANSAQAIDHELPRGSIHRTPACSITSERGRVSTCHNNTAITAISNSSPPTTPEATATPAPPDTRPVSPAEIPSTPSPPQTVIAAADFALTPCAKSITTGGGCSQYIPAAYAPEPRSLLLLRTIRLSGGAMVYPPLSEGLHVSPATATPSIPIGYRIGVRSHHVPKIAVQRRYDPKLLSTNMPIYRIYRVDSQK